MENFDRSRATSVPSSSRPISIDVQPLLRLVYMWMGAGLLTTAVVSFVTVTNDALLSLATNPIVAIVALLGSLGLVLGLSFGINRLSPTAAGVMFFVYAAVLGFTLSTIFLVYELGVIANAFLTTAVLFGAMSAIGFTTDIDLTKYSSYLMFGLIGLVLAMVVNFFLASSAFDFVISMFGVILFTALTAYDTQKIKNMAASPELQATNDTTVKLSIVGALTLYLDFINLFLFLLRLFGGGRD